MSVPGPPEAVARANARRLDLVEKKYKGGGLTPQEQAELNACARAVGEWAFRPERLAERREVLDEYATAEAARAILAKAFDDAEAEISRERRDGLREEKSR